MSAQRQRILAGGLLVFALIAGPLVGIARAGHENPWLDMPEYPGATQLGSVELHTAGIAVEHTGRDADVLHVAATIDDVAGFYAAGPEGWEMEHQTTLPDGQYVIYLTRGEQLAVVRVMSDAAFQNSSLSGDLDSPDGEADGAFVTIGLIECLDSGGVESCLGEVAGR